MLATSGLHSHPSLGVPGQVDPVHFPPIDAFSCSFTPRPNDEMHFVGGSSTEALPDTIDVMQSSLPHAPLFCV